jgi:hypothetical protein
MNHATGSRTFAPVLCALALLSASALLPARTASSAQTRGGEWVVLAPVSHGNLTIFPVRAGSERPALEGYVTLDEGTQNGTVVITERGGTPRATPNANSVRTPPNGRNAANARNRANVSNERVQQVEGSGEGASVNELALVNKSGKKLILLAGEVIVGGKQDRIVQEDRIIPPTGEPVALGVFCVEHGRWTPRSAGNSETVNVTASAVAEVASPAKFKSLGAVAHPKLRGAAQDKKEQGAVWSEVRANNARLNTQNSTDTYQEVYASREVGAQMDDYLKALEREVVQPGVVGVVVARGGRVVWADLFATPELFAHYWPKLLKSYVVDALGEPASDKHATTDEAGRYLAEHAGTVTTITQEGVYQLTKTEHTSYAVFELRDIALAAPLRLHFNKMER